MFIILIPSSLNRLEIFNNNTSFYLKISVLSQTQGLHIQCSWSTNQAMRTNGDKSPALFSLTKPFALESRGISRKKKDVFLFFF